METNDAIDCLSALSHPGRLGLFRHLVQAGEAGLPAGDVARAENLNLTTASAQLAQLAQAGLVQRTRDGRSIIYTADYGQIRGLIAFLMEDCCAGRADILSPLASLAASCCKSEERP